MTDQRKDEMPEHEADRLGLDWVYCADNYKDAALDIYNLRQRVKELEADLSPSMPDDVTVPREVLQGVRDDIQYERDKIFYLMIRGSASEYDVGLAKERLTKTLASLDAVLSEGE